MASSIKAIILARVSTEEQMTEGHSIPAQLTKAREYATKRSFKIKSEYQFDESSVKDHRVKFEKVIEEIIKSPLPVALITETVDRLQRSFKESVRLEEFRKNGKLEIHFIRENLVIHKDSNSSELQRWDLAVFMAKSYVLQISDNVKRSINERLRQGIYPSGAPLGYLNDQKAKCLVVDSKRAPIVSRGFELYATGQYSIRSIRDWFTNQGFRNRKGGTVYHSGIQKILQNPIYYGRFRYKERLYDGIHEPIISKELFNKVQNVFDRKHHPRIPSLKTFPFKSILTCGRCGTHVTAGIYKKKYSLYHCSFTKGKCGNPYINQDKLINVIGEQVIKPVTITEDRMIWIQESLKQTHGSSNDDKKMQIDTVKAQINRLEIRLDRLYEDKLDGKIPEGYWNKKDTEYRNMKADLECTLNSLERKNPNYFEDALRIFELSQKLYSLYVKANLEKKARIVNLVSSNCILNDLTLYPTYRKPFNFIAEGLSCPKKLPGHGEITNLLSTLVYICHKRVWKEKRYSLSTDLTIEKEKINPIAQARYFQQLKNKNPNFNNAYLSKILGISRVRITQMLNLLKLAPDIQEHILSAHHYTERQLRPLTQISGFDGQRKMLKAML